MSTPPKHLIFKFDDPISWGGESGAQEIATPTPVPRDLSFATMKPGRVLTFAELKSLKGIPYSRQHIDRLEKKGKFPRRIKLGWRVVWIESEIDEWLQSKADARALDAGASRHARAVPSIGEFGGGDV